MLFIPTLYVNPNDKDDKIVIEMISGGLSDAAAFIDLHERKVFEPFINGTVLTGLDLDNTKSIALRIAERLEMQIKSSSNATLGSQIIPHLQQCETRWREIHQFLGLILQMLQKANKKTAEIYEKMTLEDLNDTAGK